MRDQYIRTGQGFVLVYSITSRASFDNLSSFYNQILRVKDAENFPVVVFGNKCDLEQDREVPQTEGKQFADSIEASFFETSAKVRLNVEEGFYQLVRVIRDYQNKVTQEDGKEKKKKMSLANKLKQLKPDSCVLL